MRIYERKTRKTRFKHGRKTPANNKQGFVVNFYEPRDADDPVICRAGEKYFTWHPKGEPWQFSKERPVIVKKLNEHEETMNNFRDRFEEVGDSNDAEELLIEVTEYRDELDNRLNSMPEQLQKSSILNDRLCDLDDLITDIENWI